MPSADNAGTMIIHTELTDLLQGANLDTLLRNLKEDVYNSSPYFPFPSLAMKQFHEIVEKHSQVTQDCITKLLRWGHALIKHQVGILISISFYETVS